MIIKSVYIGNLEEAFIEDNFTKGFNVLYSNDNNKGKTIVIQSIMYCLGSNSVFPASFNHEDYYYILTIESDNELYDICRKKNNFIIKSKGDFFVFDNISEYKNYWNKHINKLPIIFKDGRRRLADLELLTQMFFTGQDKKITHDILNSGWLKKADFFNMLYSAFGVDNDFDINHDISELRSKKQKLKEEKEILLRKNKILKKNNLAIETLSVSSNRMALKEKLKAVEKTKEKLIGLNGDRNNAIKRKTKNELVLKELRSLNRTMKTGQITCMDCGSNHISYESSEAEFSFDISTSSMRSQIINSIKEKIEIYDEEIDRVTDEIVKEQKKMNAILETEEVCLEDLILAKIKLDGTESDDMRLEEISKEIESVDQQIKQVSSKQDEINVYSKDVLENIIREMNLFDSYIDPSVENKYENIFTSRYKTHSGSEGTQFHLARMYAFAKVLKHEYPIIIDSFRAEDLSTDREEKVIDKFKELDNQLIFTLNNS